MENYQEAAQCNFLIAHLIAQYLNFDGSVGSIFPVFGHFKHVCPNIEKQPFFNFLHDDESVGGELIQMSYENQLTEAAKFLLSVF